MRNTENNRLFARKALAYIEGHPEQHDQSKWYDGDPNSCGTSMCVAGTVAWLKYGDDVHDIDVEREAALLLGLTRGESEVLFYDMSEERAKAKLEKIAKGEAFTKDDFYTLTDKDNPNAELKFHDYYWSRYRDVYREDVDY